MSYEKLKYNLLPIEEEAAAKARTTPERNERWRRRFFVLAAFFALNLLVTVGLLAREVSSQPTCQTSPRPVGVKEPYSPATIEREYTNRWLAKDPNSMKFMGKPRPELDDAWHDLLEGTLIRVSEEELLMANNATSIGHVDGGYVAGLGVSHSLHCLKRIKQYMNRDYYYSSPGQDWKQLEDHADHCLESLRQRVLCHSDLSLYTLEWTPHSRSKPEVRIPQAHVCMNWERIHEWMKARQAGYTDMLPPPPSLFEGEPVS